jgi:hypothetical protein
VLRVENIWYAMNKIPEPVETRCSRAHEYVFHFAKTRQYYYDKVAIMVKAKDTQSETANKRTVWTVATKSFKGAHFAVMPDLLVKPCVLAGTSEKGCCPQCGAPWRREIKKLRSPTRPGTSTKVIGTNDKTHGNRDPRRHITRIITEGWKPACNCGVKQTKPCVVLDPFSGAGTVAKVAASKGRHFVGVELNPEYAELARKRISKAILNRGFAL